MPIAAHTAGGYSTLDVLIGTAVDQALSHTSGREMTLSRAP